MRRCHNQQSTDYRSSNCHTSHRTECTSTTVASRRRPVLGASRWLVFAAALMAVGGAASSAQAQSGKKRAIVAHHRLHHHHAIHTGHRHAVVVTAPYIAATPIVATAAVPTAQQIQVAYPLTLRFHRLVAHQKLPARIVWNNGRYWIWYGGQWCEYGWFVRTQVGGNWEWYLSRYRQKYAGVLQQCQP